MYLETPLLTPKYNDLSENIDDSVTKSEGEETLTRQTINLQPISIDTRKTAQRVRLTHLCGFCSRNALLSIITPIVIFAILVRYPTNFGSAKRRAGAIGPMSPSKQRSSGTFILADLFECETRDNHEWDAESPFVKEPLAARVGVGLRIDRVALRYDSRP